MTNPTREHPSRFRAFGGFTMIELMVVLVALGVLVAMVVGIGKVIAEGQNNKQTDANQKTIIGAVEIYEQIMQTRPPQLHYCLMRDGLFCHDPQFQSDPTYGSPNYSNEYWRMMTLTLEMSKVPECADAYVRSDAFSMDQRYVEQGAMGVFSDAYGRCMDWDVDGGFGNSPAIISVGADGYFGHATPNASPSDIKQSEAEYDRIFVKNEDSYITFGDGTSQVDYQEDNVRSDGKSKG